MDEYYKHNPNDNIRILLDNMPYCFAYCKVIANENDKPEDFFLEINKAFENIICLKRNDVVGKRVKELHTIVDRASLDWIAACDKVAFNLERVDFEYYIPYFKKWYSIIAYSSEKYSFSAILSDITDMRQREKTFIKYKNKYRELNESTQRHTLMEKWLIGLHEYLLNKD